MGDKPWYEKLRGIVDIKLDLRNFRLIHITKSVTVNKNAPVIIVDQRQKTGEVDLSGLSADQRKHVLEVLPNAVLKEKNLLLDSSVERTVEDIKETQASKEFQQVIAPLAPNIPPLDLAMLKAALYVRRKYQTRSPEAERFRYELIERYGDRGRKIANLCSAGYFEDTIIPLLEEMKSATNFEHEFKKSYETIIIESGFAVFVNAGMSEDQLKKAVLDRIKSNYRYGKQYVHIHGAGNANISKTRKCVDELQNELPGLEKVTDDKVGSTVYVRLEFDKKLGQKLLVSEEG